MAKKNMSKVAAKNASDHWAVVRRIAKQANLTPGEVQRSWSKVRSYLETFRGDYRKRKTLDPAKIRMVRKIATGNSKPPVEKSTPAKPKAKASVVTPPVTRTVPAASTVRKKIEVNTSTMTLQVELEGDPGRVIDLLLAVDRVKSVTVRK